MTQKLAKLIYICEHFGFLKILYLRSKYDTKPVKSVHDIGHTHLTMNYTLRGQIRST